MSPKVLAIASAVAAVVVWARADPSVTVVQGAPAEEALAARSRLRVAPGLKVELWAGEPLVKDITSFCFDSIGRAYVVETGRRRTSVFDIRGLQPWLDDDLSFRTVADRRDFLTRKLTAGDPDHDRFLAVLTKSGIGGFRDFNQDGTIDARDLDVESERIRLVWDSDGDGRADSATTFADGFTNRVGGVAAGILVQGTNVWFTNIPDLWRLDAKAGGPPSGPAGEKGASGSTADSPARSLLLTGFGVHIAFGGHDLHGLVKGPDGRLYFTIADRGTSVTNREGRVVSLPDCGAVFRCEPDGSSFEVFAKGPRNPQELCFDDLGNLWTADNNGDGGDKARWTLVLEGADHGWTIGWQWLPKMGAWNSERLWHTRESNTAAYIVPPVAHIGHGPAGIAWYPGTGLPARYDRHFFVSDFPGGLRTFAVEPDGAFFKVVPEPGADLAGRWMEDNSATNMVGKILWDLSPVDVAFPPGGGVTIADWVQGWEKTGKGRLWHVSDPALAGDPLIVETKRLLAEGMAGRGEKELLGLLGHRDQRVRLEAQWELAGRGPRSFGGLKETASGTGSTTTRIHALWAVGQIARSLPASEFTDELFSLLPLLEGKDSVVRAQAAMVLAEGRLLNANFGIIGLLKDEERRVRFAAATALARLDDGSGASRRKEMSLEHAFKMAPPKMARWIEAASKGIGATETISPGLKLPDTEIVEFLGADGADDPILRFAGIRALRTIRSGGLYPALMIAGRAKEPWIRLATVVALRDIGPDDNWLRFVGIPTWGEMLSHPSAEIVLEAARAINDVPNIVAAPALADLLRPASLERLQRQADGNRFGPASPVGASPENGRIKASSAAPPDASPSPREEGRGEGGHRPRSLNFTRDEWFTWVLRRAVNANFRLGSPSNAAALGVFAARTDAPESVRVEAIEDLGDWAKPPGRDKVVGTWRPLPTREAFDVAWPALVADTSTNVVIAAVRAGATLGTAGFSDKLAALREHPDPAVRAEVAKLQEVSRPATLADLTARLERGSLREQQAAFAALAISDEAGAEGVLAAQMEKLLAATLPPALALDVLEATSRRAARGHATRGSFAGSKPEASPAARSADDASRSGNPSAKLTTALVAWTNSLPKGDVFEPFRPALAGGDAANGRLVIVGRQDLACFRCHKFRGEGGDVGPELTGIGRAKGREYVLRSILFPNAEIAAGYENVVVTRKDGSNVAGVLKSETPAELVVASPEDGLVTVKKAGIAARERGLSSMLEGLGDLMSLRELRDVVEALSE